MPDLRDQLERLHQGRVVVVGVGNVQLGDDGVGVRLAESLGSARASRAVFAASPNALGGECFAPELLGEGAHRSSRGGCALHSVVVGTTPESCLIYLTESAFDTVLFLDAVEFGAVPGSVVLLDASEMTTRFPQVSTHKLSLGLLAQMIEANGRTKVWLLGVQPASLKPGEGLSPRVAATVEGLIPLLTGDCAEVMA